MDIDLATVTIFFVGTALGALLAWIFISRLKDSEITEARIENATLKAKGSSFEN